MTAQRVEVVPATVQRFAARSVAAAMQAKHLSGASIGRMVERELGRSLTTNEHQWSPKFILDAVHHSGYALTVYDTDGNGWDLSPESWVRVTQAAA